jgi:hypothetical protein
VVVEVEAKVVVEAEAEVVGEATTAPAPSRLREAAHLPVPDL